MKINTIIRNSILIETGSKTAIIFSNMYDIVIRAVFWKITKTSTEDSTNILTDSIVFNELEKEMNKL
jgi:hypothetical protein